MIDISAAERLAKARALRFPSARQAAIALGLKSDTYAQYENGLRGFSRHASRFAAFFRVNLEWLLTGRGPMAGKQGNAEIPIFGVVGAGSTILPIDDDTAAINIGDIQLPEAGAIGAVVIKGDSGFPRFQDGETLIFYTRQLSPAEVLNKTAIVQTWDGRKMIKTVRAYKPTGRYTLESWNAASEHDVDLMAAWEIYGLLFR